MKTALWIILAVSLLGVAFSGVLSYQELFGDSAATCPSPGPAGTFFDQPACIYGLFMYVTVALAAAWGLVSGASAARTKTR